MSKNDGKIAIGNYYPVEKVKQFMRAQRAREAKTIDGRQLWTEVDAELTEMMSNNDELSEELEKTVDKWVAEGRSAEQIYGVRNFITSTKLHKLINKQIIKVLDEIELPPGEGGIHNRALTQTKTAIEKVREKYV